MHNYVTFDAFPLPLFTVIDLFPFYYYNVLICEIYKPPEKDTQKTYGTDII